MELPVGTRKYFPDLNKLQEGASNFAMKVEAVHATQSKSALSSDAALKKDKAPVIAFATKRAGARRLFVAHGDIIRGTVASDAPTSRAILRMLSNCH
jgi:hypothetical protein